MKRMRLRHLGCLAVSVYLGFVSFISPTANACTTIKFKADRITLAPPTPGGGGAVNISFAQSYTNPVVFILPTNQNPDPSAIRVNNVTGTGFQMLAVEPPGSDGANTGMTVDYLVAETGTYTLPGGNLMEVGSVNTLQMQSKFIGTGSTTVNFNNSYPSAPVMLVQLQTTANEGSITPAVPSSPWMTATAFNITNANAQVALERSEDTSGAVSLPERIGYCAIQSGVVGTFPDSLANTVTYETIRSAQNIVGWDNNCVNTNFTGTYPPQPIALASKATRNGADGGWIRRCRINPNRIGLQIDEDVAFDSERSHTTEIASILLFPKPLTPWSVPCASKPIRPLYHPRLPVRQALPTLLFQRLLRPHR